MHKDSIHIHHTTHDFRKDRRLSYKARGMLAYILSHQHDWQLHVEALVNESDHDGRIAVQSGLQELLRYQYAVLETIRDSHGKVRGKKYHIHNEPMDKQLHREAQNLLVGSTDKQENRQSGNLSVGADKQVLRQTQNMPVGQQEDDVDTGLHRQAGFPSDGFPDSQETCSIKNQDLRETQREEKTKDPLPTGEGSLGAVSGAASPSTATGVSAKPKRIQVITPLAPESWTYHLLQEYAESFDVEALNDQDWWKDMAKSLPEFTKEFVSGAFADLANWLRANPRRRPRDRKGWLKRMNTSLNYYYDNKFVKRGNGQSPTAPFVTKGEQRQEKILSNMDSLVERTRAYEAQRRGEVLPGAEVPRTLLPRYTD